MNFDLAIIDMDPIVYACGFSIQKTDKETGLIECEPLKHAFYNVSSQIRKILNKTGARIHRGFLTSTDQSNFRFKIYKYYKENRVKCIEKCIHPYDCLHTKISTKPIHYNDVREFLIRRWNAEVIRDQEADDACSIAQYQSNEFGFDQDIHNSIICSIDKDFNNVPGWHYNTGKDEIYYVTPLEALKNFYLQILTGDNSDGIPRIKKGWRQKKTEELMNTATNEQQLLDIVKEEVYNLKEEEFKNSSALMESSLVEDEILWRGQLVHLRRYDNEMWSIPNE
jgi:hypothetical protein